MKLIHILHIAVWFIPSESEAFVALKLSPRFSAITGSPIFIPTASSSRSEFTSNAAPLVFVESSNSTDIALSLEHQQQIASSIDDSAIIDLCAEEPQCQKNVWDKIITKLDDPRRIHAISGSTATFGGIAWMMLQYAALNDMFHLDGLVDMRLVAALSLSYVSLMLSGTRYLPKGRRYKYYRRIFFSTDIIMAGDLLLWILYSGGALTMDSSAVTLVSAMSLLGVLGDIDFFISDTASREEFFENGLVDKGIAHPSWKYISILPTHSFLALNRIIGATHLMVGGAPWLESHPHAAAFGSAMYMSLLMTAAWSSFVQGTLPFRRVYRVELTFSRMALQLAPFLPLVPTALVGVATGSLQEFYGSDHLYQGMLSLMHTSTF